MDAAPLQLRRRLTLPRPLLARAPDERLVGELRQGNEQAFESLYDRHHRGLLSFCRHLLGSQEDAEDAVQQSFVSAHGAVLADNREITFKPWLYAIARNRCLSMLRGRRESSFGEVPEPATNGLADEVEQRADLRQLLADLSQLPEPQRAALVLFELGDLSQDEAAAVLGCDVARVKQLVFRARSALREGREARELPCVEVREEVATTRGVGLSRTLRRHLRSCPGCAAFRDDVGSQRKGLAVVLPVVAAPGLKSSVLAAIGTGGGTTTGGLAAGIATQTGSTAGATTAGVGAGTAGAGATTAGAGAGGAAGGGLFASMLGGAGVAKTATVALATGGLALGGTAAVAGLGNRGAGEGDRPTQAAARPAKPPGMAARPGTDGKDGGKVRPKTAARRGTNARAENNVSTKGKASRGGGRLTKSTQPGKASSQGRQGRSLAGQRGGVSGTRGKAQSARSARGGASRPSKSQPQRRGGNPARGARGSKKPATGDLKGPTKRSSPTS